MGLLNSYPDRYLPRDSVSGHLEIIEPEHDAVHDGVHYTASHYVTVGTVTAVTVLITAPASTTSHIIHFIAEVEADKSGTWTFSEDPVATGGSALTSYNHDRESVATSPMTLHHTTTVAAASVGTVLERHIVGSAGTNQSKVGGNTGGRREWLLKRGKRYLLRFVAGEADTQIEITVPYYYRDIV